MAGHLIKICGITNEADAVSAVEYGASAIGLNFYAGSVRYVTEHRASEIARQIPDTVLRVGIFVNPTADDLERIAREVPLDVVQVHGEFPGASSVRVWRALAVDESFRREQLRQDEAEAYLLDAPAPGYGGSGQTFEWSRVSDLPARILLAGGLNASNVATAIATARPWGVDACSRLESAPGKKDAGKLRAFVSTAAEAFAALEESAAIRTATR